MDHEHAHSCECADPRQIPIPFADRKAAYEAHRAAYEAQLTAWRSGKRDEPYGGLSIP